MSQDFNLNFWEENHTPGPGGGRDANLYSEPGHVRNLCFEWPDGTQKFQNYAYLISGEFRPDDGTVTLAFTAETIVMQGINLLGLFRQLLQHEVKHVKCVELRYQETEEPNAPLVKAITIIANH